MSSNFASLFFTIDVQTLLLVDNLSRKHNISQIKVKAINESSDLTTFACL